MSETEVSHGRQPTPSRPSVRRGLDSDSPSISTLAGPIYESWKYLIASLLALIIDYGLLILLTEAGHLYYLLSTSISYCAGAVVHYMLCTRWVFNARRLDDRRVECAAFCAIGLLGLGVTQLVLWGAVAALHLSYLTGKIAATAVSFALNFTVRKAMLFSADGRLTA